MDRELLISILKIAASYKTDINAFINNLDENNVGTGKIEVPDKLLYSLLEAIIREKSNGSIYDLQVAFDDGYIFIAFKVKKFMTISVSAVIEIIDFKFNSAEHTAFFSYHLLGQSFKNMAIHDFIKSFSRNSDLLKKGIVIGNNSISVSFDKLIGEDRIPDWLTLKYEKCDGGKLVFKYEI
ncbi:MAG: hypothetical protein PHW03_00015 [Eubacteriales bacterium]|nr:hypothetical protein [Eubacteriales bacterium]MDD4389171.1 hypothetical protein [Eubacteriales bacterium]